MITILIIDRRSSAWEQFWWEQLCWQLPYAQESAYIKIKKQEGAADAAGVTEAVLPAVNRKGTGRSTSLSMFLYRKFRFELSTVGKPYMASPKKGSPQLLILSTFSTLPKRTEINSQKIQEILINYSTPFPKDVVIFIMRRDPAQKRRINQREESWEES